MRNGKKNPQTCHSHKSSTVKLWQKAACAGFVWDSCTEHYSPLKAPICLSRHTQTTLTFPLYPRQTRNKEATNVVEQVWENHSETLSNSTATGAWKTRCVFAHCAKGRRTWPSRGEVDGMDIWICFGGRRQRINGRHQATSGFHRNPLVQLSAVFMKAGGGRKITEERH